MAITLGPGNPLLKDLALPTWPSVQRSAYHLPGSNGDQSTLGAYGDNPKEPQLGGHLYRYQQ